MRFSDRAIQQIADDKIRSAIEGGEFDHLPGFGKPLALLDEPYDENWWVRRKLQAEGLKPQPEDVALLSPGAPKSDT